MKNTLLHDIVVRRRNFIREMSVTAQVVAAGIVDFFSF